MPRIMGKSRATRASTARRPMPGQAKIVSVSTAPERRKDIWVPHDSYHRDESVLESMPSYYDSFRKSLGPGSPHVILIKDLKHAGSGKSRNEGRRAESLRLLLEE